MSSGGRDYQVTMIQYVVYALETYSGPLRLLISLGVLRRTPWETLAVQPAISYIMESNILPLTFVRRQTHQAFECLLRSRALRPSLVDLPTGARG
jgi:hypothetical protein